MVQYRDTHLTLPLAAPVRSPARTPPWQGTHPVLWFAQRYPLVFWSSLFSSLMLLTALATVLLLTPLRPEAARSRAVPTVPPAIVAPNSATFSALWALGAITASCALVSLLLTTSLRVAKQRRRLIKHSIPAPSAEPRHRYSQAESSTTTPLPPQGAVATAFALGANLTPLTLTASPEGMARKAVIPAAAESQNRAAEPKEAGFHLPRLAPRWDGGDGRPVNL